MPKYATSPWGPIYVQTIRAWAGIDVRERLVAAADLKEARARYGHTGMRYEDASVRRATWSDVDRLGGIAAMER